MALFGTSLEAELESIEGKNSKDINRKRTKLMTKWLDLPQRYRSPMASTKHKDSDPDQEFMVQGDMF